MKILILGGHGFIGHNVAQQLTKLGHYVGTVDVHHRYGEYQDWEYNPVLNQRLDFIGSHSAWNVDVCDSGKLRQVFAEFGPDVVIDLATYPNAKMVKKNVVDATTNMVAATAIALDLCVEFNVQRFVLASSSMVYGDFEDQVTEDSECNPIGQYGIMKLAGEQLVKDYHRRGAFDYVIIRPSAVYGPLDVEDRVVAKFMLAAMRGETLKVNGAEETLDFTYVDDAADGIVSATTRIMSANRIYNITKSHSVTLLEAAEMIVKIVGKGSVEIRDKDADFPSQGALDIDRARVILGYNPKVDVEEGFQRYYEWLKNSLYWSKKTV